MTGLALLGFIVLTILIGPFFVPYSPTAVSLDHVREAPSWAHLLGTDDTGRDVLARLLAGGRVSLLVGFSAAVSALVVGTVLGVVSGWAGGLFDLLVTRVTEQFMAVPSVLVMIVLAGVLGPSAGLLVVVIAAFSWPTCCRMARGIVLGTRELDYVRAARACGTRPWRIVVRHLLPAVLPQAAVAGTTLVAISILSEAGLSFLGLGVTPPQASWGSMLMEVRSFAKLAGMPWLWLPPGLAITLTGLAIAFAGDGLRTALDPRVTR